MTLTKSLSARLRVLRYGGQAFLWMGLVTTVGCTNAIKPLKGTIGPYTLHRATAQPFLGPNITQIWAYDHTNAPACVYSASGEGCGPVVIKALGSAAGLIGGAAVLGSTLRPDTTHIEAGNTTAGEIFIQR